MSPVTAYAHTGLTIRSLAASLRFWHHCLGLPVQRHFTLSGPTVPTTTGAPPGSVIHAAHVSLPIPGAGNAAAGPTLELLEYEIPGRPHAEPVKPRAWEIGAAHVAVRVEGLDGVVARAEGEGWGVVGGVVTFGEEEVEGRLRGWRVCYLRGPDGEMVEVMEPPAEQK